MLNLLTESARVHRQTRKFLKAKVTLWLPRTLSEAALKRGENIKQPDCPPPRTLLWLRQGLRHGRMRPLVPTALFPRLPRSLGLLILADS